MGLEDPDLEEDLANWSHWDEKFVEIPEHLMKNAVWKVQRSAKWQFADGIVIKEARASVAGLPTTISNIAKWMPH